MPSCVTLLPMLSNYGAFVIRQTVFNEGCGFKPHEKTHVEIYASEDTCASRGYPLGQHTVSIDGVTYHSMHAHKFYMTLQEVLNLPLLEKRHNEEAERANYDASRFLQYFYPSLITMEPSLDGSCWLYLTRAEALACLSPNHYLVADSQTRQLEKSIG